MDKIIISGKGRTEAGNPWTAYQAWTGETYAYPDYLTIEKLGNRFLVASFPAWIEEERRKVFGDLVAGAASWVAVHKIVSRFMGVAVITAQQNQTAYTANKMLEMSQKLQEARGLLIEARSYVNAGQGVDLVRRINDWIVRS